MTESKVVESTACDRCEGTGRFIGAPSDACAFCDGTGLLPKRIVVHRADVEELIRLVQKTYCDPAHKLGCARCAALRKWDAGDRVERGCIVPWPGLGFVEPADHEPFQRAVAEAARQRLQALVRSLDVR